MANPIWLKQPTAMAALPPAPARLVLGLVALLLAFCLTAVTAPEPPKAYGDAAHHAEDRADILLYQRIVQGLGEGEDYYPLVAESLRTGNYPLKPFVTFRLPSLATVQAAFPPAGSFLLMIGLAGAVLRVWWLWLGSATNGRRSQLIGAALLVCGVAVLAKPEMVPFHEPWAALLVALSLGCRTEERWGVAVVTGLAAMLIRETAALYVAVMAGMALIERRPREILGWGAALTVFALAVAAHAAAVSDVVRTDDPASPGWAGMLGFGFTVNVLRGTTSLAHLPTGPALLLTGLALFGWAAAPGALARRVLATILAYGTLLALFCRADTFYWGLMIAPAFLVGLVFVPDGLKDLIAAARLRPRTA
ncbi:hypothetical protein HJG53_03670 [Sphingomonas sp. ID1715]|uniref:hypothetical protein n=1 Tax=Sphingomonas sp. ID1715 TaxID=1656898 RepID=UPI00148983C3|nr:hypothetical protein [Sphingomonas sp. ID1715]NNM76006.1 hypothetical protein [Sphingomonas sp. ID1715]